MWLIRNYSIWYFNGHDIMLGAKLLKKIMFIHNEGRAFFFFSSESMLHISIFTVHPCIDYCCNSLWFLCHVYFNNYSYNNFSGELSSLVSRLPKFKLAALYSQKVLNILFLKLLNVTMFDTNKYKKKEVYWVRH